MDKPLEALYKHTDSLTDAVHKTYPFWPCKKGCAVLNGRNCCHTSLFPVSEREWKRIRQGLKSRPRAYREALKARAQEIYDQYVPHAETFSELYEKASTEIAPCPFLIDNTCSIYKDRPAICRSFGYFAQADTEDSHYYWCSHVSAVAQAHGVRSVPSWKNLTERMRAVLRGKTKPLCAWVVEDL